MSHGTIDRTKSKQNGALKQALKSNIWNADRQDRTPWAGTAINCNQDYAMKRNADEASGVWGLMPPIGNDYLAANIINYKGLEKIGELTPKICPPKWPWPIDKKKAACGELIYKASCNSCQGIEFSQAHRDQPSPTPGLHQSRM